MTTDPHPGLTDAPDRPGAPTDAPSDEPVVVPAPAETAPEPSTPVADAPKVSRRGGARRSKPSWMHRQHPVFTPLSGFFTGLGVVIVIPAIFGAVLKVLLPDDTAEKLYPFALLVFLIPIGLIVARRTRRFGRYMLLGMVLTAIVVLAAAALTVLVLIKKGG